MKFIMNWLEKLLNKAVNWALKHPDQINEALQPRGSWILPLLHPDNKSPPDSKKCKKIGR